MSGLLLISSRSAFLPPLAAAKALSHSFSSARRSVAVVAAIVHGNIMRLRYQNRFEKIVEF